MHRDCPPYWAGDEMDVDGSLEGVVSMRKQRVTNAVEVLADWNVDHWRMSLSPLPLPPRRRMAWSLCSRQRV